MTPAKWVSYWFMLKIGTIQTTLAILSLIARIDEFKGAWRALGTLAPDRLSALRRVATIESIGSSTRIEGSKLSDREVEQLLSNLEIKSFATRDEQEVAGYAELMDLVAWVNQERETAQLHPLLIIALCVVVFLEIHPFQDGNRRLCRVLTTLLLLQAGYLYVPCSSLERSARNHPTGSRGWCSSCAAW